MWKSIFLAGMGVVVAVTAVGAVGNESALDRPDGPFKKTVHATIQGKLQKVVELINVGPRVTDGKPRYPTPNLFDYVQSMRWEVLVNDKAYELEVGTEELATLATKLQGQTVYLEGDVEVRLREKRIPAGPDGIRPLIAYRPIPVQVVVVTCLRAAPAESFHETQSVVVSGKLQMKAHLGYPARDAIAVLRSGGKTYVLDFGADSVHRLAAELYDGETIVVTGDVAGFYTVPSMCIPTQKQLPIVRVASLKSGRGEYLHRTITVRIKGKLDQTSVWTGARDYEDEPEFRITVDGKTYGLEFADKQSLQDLAARLNGKTVNLTGTLELRRTFAGTMWQIVTVQGLQVDPGDFVRLTERSTFCCPLVPKS
jgi:hypothetical protein